MVEDAAALLLSSHEERLGRVEQASGDAKAASIRTEGQVKELTGKFEGLDRKMDDVVDTIKPLSVSITSLSTMVNGHEKAATDAAAETKAKKKDRSGLFWGLVVGIGVLVGDRALMWVISLVERGLVGQGH